MSDAYGDTESRGASAVLVDDRYMRRIGEVVSSTITLVIVAMLAWIVTTQVSPDLLVTIFPRFVDAYLLVIQVVVISSVLSVILGVLVGLGRISTSPITNRIASGYVEFFRGTPLLFQLFLIYFGVPRLFPPGGFPITNWEIPAAIVGLTLNHGAYVGEAVRGGIGAVPDGQMEAARSLGMSRVMGLRKVVLPQAWRNALAAIGNDQIILVKDTSLLTVIAVPEIMSVFRNVNSTTFDPWTPLVWVALFYLAITVPMSKLVQYLEGRADWGGDRS